MKPLLVGEANPYQSDPRLAQRYALYPDPERCAGWNLCHRVMQLDEDEYLRRFDRVNLCDGKWGMKEAREHAGALTIKYLLSWVDENALAASSPHKSFVLCGSKVCSAFTGAARLRGLPEVSFQPFTINTEYWSKMLPLVILPHPSGLSRAWNEPGAHERARAVLREAGVL